MIDFKSAFVDITQLAALNTLIAGWLITHITGTGGTKFLGIIKGNQLVSWVTALCLSFLGHFAGFGILADTTVLWTIVTGFAVGTVSNGIADVSIVQSLLTLLKAKK